jgi:predicted DsbA family dithiol-disulfide isomerase
MIWLNIQLPPQQSRPTLHGTEQRGKYRMSRTTWRADPLVWGHGPRVFEVFLEPTCPFSVRAFGKLDDLLAQAGEDRITIKVRLQSQPWHMYSGVIVRCILAASTLQGGKQAAKAVMTAVAAHREEFEFDHHCRGANMNATPNDIIARIEGYSGVKLAEAFAVPDLDREIKWHCKYARQNGIHVSPTFMIDGLVEPGMSSGDDVSAWASRLL